MPYSKKYAKKATKPVRKVRGRRYGARRVVRRANTPEMASLSVKFTATNNTSTLFSSNALYRNTSIALVDLGPRAASVAAAYGQFRISKVTATFKPLADTFSSSNSVSKPNLYWMLDKSGAVPATITLEGLKAMGAKPISLDEKPIKITWTPTIILSDTGATGSTVRSSPWLPTATQGVLNNSSHKGLYWYVETLQGSQGYAVEFEVQLQFKKPLITGMVSETAAVDVRPAILDGSSNGIEDDIA